MQTFWHNLTEKNRQLHLPKSGLRSSVSGRHDLKATRVRDPAVVIFYGVGVFGVNFRIAKTADVEMKHGVVSSDSNCCRCCYGCYCIVIVSER